MPPLVVGKDSRSRFEYAVWDFLAYEGEVTPDDPDVRLFVATAVGTLRPVFVTYLWRMPNGRQI